MTKYIIHINGDLDIKLVHKLFCKLFCFEWRPNISDYSPPLDFSHTLGTKYIHVKDCNVNISHLKEYLHEFTKYMESVYKVDEDDVCDFSLHISEEIPTQYLHEMDLS